MMTPARVVSLCAAIAAVAVIVFHPDSIGERVPDACLAVFACWVAWRADTAGTRNRDRPPRGEEDL